MARFEVLSSIDPLLRISLEPGESVAAESNAMVAYGRIVLYLYYR